jgi:hypothetical protein
MATVTITIHTDNAAFEDDPWGEVASILEKQVARDMRNEYYYVGNVSTGLIDVMGNVCGKVTIEED